MYFPAPARARAVELMLIGELLSREERYAAYGPQGVFEVDGPRGAAGGHARLTATIRRA